MGNSSPDEAVARMERQRNLGTRDGTIAALEDIDDTCRHGVSFDEWCGDCLAEMHEALG